MGNRYYTHFIAEPEAVCAGDEWHGVVELSRPLSRSLEERELSAVLAGSLELEPSDIRILDWSPLH
jgi:hypothetical protein